MRKLAACLSKLTNSREGCRRAPCAPEPHVLWRALSRGTANSHEPRLLSRTGCANFPPARKMTLDRIFCLLRGSEVAQERGDSQQGIVRMQAAQKLLKESPFESDMKELHISIDLAEAYRMAGLNRQASATFEQAASLLIASGS